MSEAEAEAFCDQRKAAVDRWTKETPRMQPSSEGDGDWFSVSYWHWFGQGRQASRRIHCVGRTLAGAVEACLEKEK